MYDELGRLLDGRASPELTEAMVRLDAVLAKVGFTMHREELDYLFANESNVAATEILLNIDVILRTAAAVVLDQFTVETADEIPLRMLSSLIEALGDFAPNDNFDTIDAIIKVQMAGDETLCDILELLTEFSSSEYLPYIAVVGDKLIPLIEEKIEEFASSQVVESINTAQTVERIGRYRSQHPSVLAPQLDQAGIPMGASMEHLYPQFTEQLLGLSIESAVHELVYLTLHSDVSTEALADEAAHFIEDLYQDIESNQKATLALHKELAALEHYVLKGE